MNAFNFLYNCTIFPLNKYNLLNKNGNQNKNEMVKNNYFGKLSLIHQRCWAHLTQNCCVTFYHNPFNFLNFLMDALNFLRNCTIFRLNSMEAFIISIFKWLPNFLFNVIRLIPFQEIESSSVLSAKVTSSTK